MASGPEPPSFSVSLSPPTTGNDPSVASPASGKRRPRPPSILLEPTSDGEGNSILDLSQLDGNTTTGTGTGTDDPFHFEVGDTDAYHDGQPLNAHDAALLRRSPSPVLDFALPPPPRSPRSAVFSSSLGSSFLSPDGHLHGRGSNSNSGSFLRPPTAPGSPAAAMDDQPPLSSSPANSAPINVDGAPADNPFNFQTQYISTSPVKSNIGLRRGHRYKHSSVSAQHQIFQEPPPRPPPVLPASLPIPTLREAWASMHRDQRIRLYWCMCHAAVAVFVFLCAAEGGDSLALTALSHLVFFDVGSAAVCVAVDVLGNFEVWRRSTIRHPFGLRRAEVLAGFAMSIFLVFGGFDLLSHDLKDCLEAATASSSTTAPHAHAAHVYAFEAAAAAADAAAAAAHHVVVPHMDIGSHSGHHHSRYIHPGTVDVAALAAFASTLVSAYGLGNHARIRRALLLLHGVAPVPRFAGKNGLVASFLASLSSAASLLSRLGLSSVLANPFHFLTMAVSLVLLVLPLMFVAVQTWLDRLLCATIAVSMLLLGARLAVAQGLMLLMSYSGKEGSTMSAAMSASASLSVQQQQQQQAPLPSSSPSSVALEKNTPTVASVLDEIAAEPQITRVEDAQFWQVHYGLCMANLRVRVAQGSGDDATLRQLRSRIARVVQNRLGEGYGRGNSLRWEVTVQTSVEG